MHYVILYIRSVPDLRTRERDQEKKKKKKRRKTKERNQFRVFILFTYVHMYTVVCACVRVGPPRKDSIRGYNHVPSQTISRIHRLHCQALRIIFRVTYIRPCHGPRPLGVTQPTNFSYREQKFTLRTFTKFNVSWNN